MRGTDCMPSHQENKNVNLVGVCRGKGPLVCVRPRGNLCAPLKKFWFEPQLRVIYVYYFSLWETHTLPTCANMSEATDIQSEVDSYV